MRAVRVLWSSTLALAGCACSAPPSDVRDANALDASVTDSADAPEDAFSCTLPEYEVTLPPDVDCYDLAFAMGMSSGCVRDADCTQALGPAGCACMADLGAACGRDVFELRALFDRLGAECGLADSCAACEPSSLACVDGHCRQRGTSLPACSDATRAPSYFMNVPWCACGVGYLDFVARVDDAGVVVEVRELDGAHHSEWTPELATCLLDGYWFDACFPLLAGHEVALGTGSCTL